MTLNDLKRMSVRVRPEMHEWLMNNASSRGLTLNAMVILALESYMSQQMVLPYLPKIMNQLDKKTGSESGFDPQEFKEFQKRMALLDAAAKDSSD